MPKAKCALTSGKKGANFNVMNQGSKNLVSLVLAFFFGLAILCASLAAPGQTGASVSDCSQTTSAMAMAGCELPSYLCGSASNLFSPGALSSARSNDSLTNALGLALGATSIDVSSGLAPPGAREWKNVFPAESGKVSIHLFNSILNL